MALPINVCGIEPESIVDGPGFRYVVFVQGCPHHCPGCHNPQSHPFEGGTPRTAAELFAEFSQNPLLSGITLSGGEPFCQAEALCELASLVKQAGKTVVAYSGYTLEQLLEKAKDEIPMGKIQKTIDWFSYQTLRRIWIQRHKHRLPMWHDFCKWIENLPFFNTLIMPDFEKYE